VIFWDGLNNPEGSFSSRKNVKLKDVKKFRPQDVTLDDCSDVVKSRQIRAFTRCLIELNLEGANAGQDKEYVDNAMSLLMSVIQKELGSQVLETIVSSISLQEEA
jgi:hypothetical protein